MRKIVFVIFACFVSSTILGQEIEGQWNGVLNVHGTQLRIVFHISKTDNGYNSTMDSPDQGLKGIPVTSTIFEDSILRLGISKIGIEYIGILRQNLIIGNFKQGGQSFSLNLSKEIIQKEKLKRPQEPTKPYSYYSEDITFENEKAGISLAGTLTLPQKEGIFSAVILISGSGPQNRDEEIDGHKPFLVLTDYLTKNGIAVLRYDDRGTALSKGDFESATSLDFSSDAESALKYLQTRKEINKDKIGLIGHSEGGMIAPMVATNSKHVAFIVLLAGPGIPCDQLLLLQLELIGKASGMSDEDLKKSKQFHKGAFEIVKKSESLNQVKKDLRKYLKQIPKNDLISEKPPEMSKKEYIEILVNEISTPWRQYFLKYNPAILLEKVKCPILAINGEKDLQVSPKENLDAIERALKNGGNMNVTIKELPNLNHMFQECTTGSPDEYSTIEQTISLKVLTAILDWIQMQTK